MSVRDHQRARLRDESAPVDLDALLSYDDGVELGESDAAIVTHYVGDFGAVALDDDDVPWTPRALPLPPEAVVEDAKPRGYVFFPEDDASSKADPRWVVDGRFDYHANDVDDRTLRPGYTICRGSSSGSNGGGKAKPAKPRKLQPKVVDAEDLPVRFSVWGLTIGEVEFYYRKPTLAASVLREHVGAYIQHLLADTSYRPPVEKRPKAGRSKPFEIYGLSEAQVRILRCDPGSARTALAIYAREHDGERIRHREAA